MLTKDTPPKDTPPDDQPSQDSPDALASVDAAAFDRTNLGLLARDLHRAMSRAIDERVARYGLASHTCRYLAIIRSHEGITPKELSDYLSVRSPTTLAALRILEEKRLVKRMTDATDRRKSPYKLTARGAEIEALVRASALEVERVAVSCLTAREVETFGRMVQSVQTALDKALL